MSLGFIVSKSHALGAGGDLQQQAFGDQGFGHACGLGHDVGGVDAVLHLVEQFEPPGARLAQHFRFLFPEHAGGLGGLLGACAVGLQDIDPA